MRQQLKEIDAHRGWFRGIFAGTAGLDAPDLDATLKKKPSRPIALLHHISEIDDQPLTDHLWFPWQCFEQLAPQKGDALCFMATVRAYQKSGDLWDYGLGQTIWMQLLSSQPKALPIHPVPPTQTEAERMLSAAMKIHQDNPTKYPIENCHDWGIRLYQWNDKFPQLIEALVLEGWAEPNPSPVDYWHNRSPAFRALAPLKSIVAQRLCDLACLINGAEINGEYS